MEPSGDYHRVLTPEQRDILLAQVRDDVREVRRMVEPLAQARLRERVEGLEDNWKWFFRSVMFLVVAGLVGALFAIAGLQPPIP